MKNIIDKAGYEILEESVSLYIGFNNHNGQYDIIRLIGSKGKSINNIVDYLKTENNKFGYKIYITFNLYPEQIEDKYSDLDENKLNYNIDERLTKLKLLFNQFDQIIESISELTFTNYGQSITDCLIENDEYYQLEFDGYITANQNLIKYIIKKLLENRIDIAEVTSLDDEISFDKVKKINLNN